MGEDKFILTSNRDESPLRATIQLTHAKQGSLLYPKDLSAGGTWICVSNDNRLVCLLNGAFEKHKRKDSYRRSRGLVVTDFFDMPTQDFFDNYDLTDIEPFTMVIYDNKKLYELRRDDSQTHINVLDIQQPYIWSSSTLYPVDIRAERRAWFEAWLTKQKEYTVAGIRELHKKGGKGDIRNDFFMNRDGIVQTVSITSVIKDIEVATLIYEDMNTGVQETASIEMGIGCHS